MGERFDAAKQAAASAGRTVKDKLGSAEQAVYKAGYRAADGLTAKYMQRLKENGFEPATSRYVNDFLHPENVVGDEPSLLAETQASHDIPVHMPEMSDDEKVLLMQGINAYLDICKGAAHDHIDPKSSKAVQEALKFLEPAVFFVAGLPEALAVTTIGPKTARKLGMWGGNDKEWGEVWLRSGPFTGDPDHLGGPYRSTYSPWGVWFKEADTVYDGDNPFKKHVIEGGRIADPPKEYVQPKPQKERDRRTTAGGAPQLYDDILRDKREEYRKSHKGRLDPDTDADIRREAKDEYNRQFRGKRTRPDDW